MRSRTVAALLLLSAGCFKPTWKRVEPGAALRPDTVVLVGSISSDPPFDQHHVPRDDCHAIWVNGHYEPPGKVIFVQETDGNLMAFFTTDLSERWNSDALRPITRFDWTYVPIDGHFFLEVPRAEHVYLRGFTYLTNAGGAKFELPAQVDIGPQDRVVYVGEIRLHRGGRRAVEFRNAVDGAKRAAQARGLQPLLQAPWKVRLLKTFAPGPPLGDEFLDGCGGRKKL